MWKPWKTLLGLVSYGLIQRNSKWQQAVHRFFGYGASRRHKIVNQYADQIKDDQRYLWSLHPHSVLADGWHSVIARNPDSFSDEGNGPPTIGRKIALCFAPVVQRIPVHQEMYRDRCCGADKKSIVQWWRNTPESNKTDPALIPGGFAEAVFADAQTAKHVEYSYLKDRKGFIRICLEEHKDIIPVYTFGATRMYNNPSIMRGWRARFSQHYFLGLVLPLGKMGTAMPLTDETTTVVFPPFELTRYTVDQLDEAHAAYLDHLKTYFNLHKAEYGMGGVKLLFVGNDFEDEDIVARSLRRLGVISSQVKTKAITDAPNSE